MAAESAEFWSRQSWMVKMASIHTKMIQANELGNQVEVLKVKKVNYTWSLKFEFLKL